MGPDHFDRLERRKVAPRLVRKLNQLGYEEVTNAETHGYDYFVCLEKTKAIIRIVRSPNHLQCELEVKNAA